MKFNLLVHKGVATTDVAQGRNHWVGSGAPQNLDVPPNKGSPLLTSRPADWSALQGLNTITDAVTSSNTRRDSACV